MIKLTTKQFIEQAKDKHGDNFNYEEVIYEGYHKKVTVSCKKHQNKFEIAPGNHLSGKGGCKKCMMEKMTKTNEFFIQQVRIIHNDFYIYDKTSYIEAHKKVIVTCKKHGDFTVCANDHIKGDGCLKCGLIRRSDKNRYTNKQFIEKCLKIHKDKFDYSLCDYYDCKSVIRLICPIHGEFKIKASQHLQKYGCQLCGKDKQIKNLKENPTGWSLKHWEEHGETSKEFESFKMYIIKCWNEEEEFYKIGRTFKNLNKRFRTINCLPYNWEIVHLFVNTAEEAFYQEVSLKKQYNYLKYLPNINFAGKYECFTTDLPIQEIIAYLNSI